MKTGLSIARRQLLLCLAGTGPGSCLAQEGSAQSREHISQTANLQVIRRYCAAWRVGDLAALRDCYHDEFTLHYGGNNPFAGDHAGKTAALATLAEVSRRTRRRLLAIIDYMAGPYRAVIIAREAFERDGQRAELDRLFVYTIKTHKLHECWAYDFDQATVDRFLAAGSLP